MAWYRVFYSAGGGRHRQFDVEVGSKASVRVLQWDDDRPERYVKQQVELYVRALEDDFIFGVDDRGKGNGFEVSHVWPVAEADKDEVPKETEGDNVPTKPDPDALREDEAAARAAAQGGGQP